MGAEEVFRFKPVYWPFPGSSMDAGIGDFIAPAAGIVVDLRP